MKQFTIRWKFIFSSFAVVLTTVLIICLLTAFTLNRNLDSEVAQFRLNETARAMAELKNFVDIAYSFVEKSYLATEQGTMLPEEARQVAAEHLERLRYDGGTGYFWVNDSGRPIPKMIMHPTVPSLNGKILDDQKFNCALGKGINLFVAMADAVSSPEREGYVDYLWPKPTKDGLTSDQPKLSFVRYFEPFDWIIGTGKYIDDIDAAVAVKRDETEQLIANLVLSISLISIVLLVLAIFPLMFAAGRIASPITRCIEFAGTVERGDLSGYLEVRSRDETGLLAQALNSMVQTTRQILSDVYQHSALVVMVSNLLEQSSDNMSTTSKQVSDQTGSVAAATEQVATNLSTVALTVTSLSERSKRIASKAHEMSENVNAVAAAVEEMSQSFQSVASHCSDARLAADRNQRASDLASVRINDLSEAADNIGTVISLIDQITEQTKLLALNATIEAARAGEAGKGFSVVANEVKELAGQTAKATDAISTRILEMQKKTDEVVAMIKEVSGNNRELSEINTSIASAVEEQSVTTTDIARTVAGAADATSRVSNEVNQVTTAIQGEISVNVQEASQGVTNVSSSLQEVNQGIRENASTAIGNKRFSSEMARLAGETRERFARFNLGNERFDIGTVKAAHIAWKLHLESMLNRGSILRVADIPDHTRCDFGKWLATSGAEKLHTHPAFPEMIDLHEKIHRQAVRIIELFNKGKEVEAQEQMTVFNQTSGKLFEALDRLYAE